MSLEWIPKQKHLERKREVLVIARRTGMSRYEVVGRLCAFWDWCDDESRDGRVPDVTRADLASALDAPRAFFDALVEIGWLDETPSGIEIPNFDRWLGRSAKRRMQASARKRRGRGVGEESEESGSDVAEEMGFAEEVDVVGEGVASRVPVVVASSVVSHVASSVPSHVEPITPSTLRSTASSSVPSAVPSIATSIEPAHEPANDPSIDSPAMSPLASEQLPSTLPPTLPPITGRVPRSNARAFERLMSHPFDFGHLRASAIVEQLGTTSEDLEAWLEFEEEHGTVAMRAKVQRYRNPRDVPRPKRPRRPRATGPPWWRRNGVSRISSYAHEQEGKFRGEE